MRSHYDVVIVGCGVVGTSAALLLSKIQKERDIAIAIIDRKSILQGYEDAVGKGGAEVEIAGNGDSNRAQSSEEDLLPFNYSALRLFAIANGSCEFLQKISIKMEDLEFQGLAQAINQIQVLEKNAQLNFDPHDMGLNNFGYMINEYDLLKQLRKKLLKESRSNSNFDLLDCTSIEEIIEDRESSAYNLYGKTSMLIRQYNPLVDLSAVFNEDVEQNSAKKKGKKDKRNDKGTLRKISASIILAADGRHSDLRNLINQQEQGHLAKQKKDFKKKFFSGICSSLGVRKGDLYEYDYKQIGIVCTIQHSLHHKGIAVEKFTDSGPFAILPQAGGYSSSLVWIENNAIYNDLQRMIREDQQNRVQQYGKGSDGNKRGMKRDDDRGKRLGDEVHQDVGDFIESIIEERLEGYLGEIKLVRSKVRSNDTQNQQNNKESGKRSTWENKVAEESTEGRLVKEMGQDINLCHSSTIGDYIQIFPLKLLHNGVYVSMGSRVALLGDAAHAIHPIAGQGLNLGLRDVALMAEIIEDAMSKGLDCGSSFVLSQYNIRRKLDASLMIAATSGLNSVFLSDVLPLKLMRRFGLRLIEGSKVWKRLFALYAVGDAKI